MKKISIVTPCYNEEDCIDVCYQRVKEIFRDQLSHYDYEHIICDNASTDNTVALLKAFAENDPRVKLILNARNFGPMRNNYNGVMAASGDAVLLFLPADLQDPPELIPEFVQLWEQGYEIVYGIRATRQENWLMASVRRAYYRIVCGLSDLNVPPDVGDFQLIDKKVHSALMTFEDSYPFMRMMTFECGFKKVGVPYTWQSRKAGLSKNRIHHLIDQGLNGLITFTNVPMRLALLSGIILASLSMIYALITLITNLLWWRTAQPGIPTLIIAIFFFSGVQLFFIGFLGEYILAIYGQVRKRPMIIERERINF
jgi:glycosyltransferase involved in cell wall biosynthesis